MFVAELVQGRIQALYLLNTLIIQDRALLPGQAFYATGRELTLLDGVHSLPRKATFFVDEQVVHHPAQPRSGAIDRHQVVDFAVGFEQQLLEQILSLGLAAGEAPGETVQAIEVRPHQALEGQVVIRNTHYVAECNALLPDDKGVIGSLSADD